MKPLNYIFINLFFLAFTISAQAKIISQSQEMDIEKLALLEEAIGIIKNDYIEEVDDGKLIASALNGILTSLDPHSSYIPKEVYEDMELYTKGEFGGIGVEFSIHNNFITVVAPLDGGPALEAGIKAGDVITNIDKEAVLGLNKIDAIKKIRGKSGTKVKLTIMREGSAGPIEFELIRKIVKIDSASYKKLDDNIALLRISAFAENTPDLVLSILKKIHESSEIKGLIIDIRNNPGGLLDSTVKIANFLLPFGKIVEVKGRNSENSSVFDVYDSAFKYTNIPIVVITNNGTASAAEILAGAIKDNKRGVIIGSKTFGKGSVQTIMPLADGSAISLTTGLYYTSSGISIQNEGILPDIKVDEESEKATQNEIDDTQNNDKSLAYKSASNKLNQNNDNQLIRAIEIIKGILVYSDEEKPKN